MLRRLVATVLAGSAALVVGCSSDQPSDELMLTDNPVPATPAVSPPATTKPAGTVIPLRARAKSVVVTGNTRQLAVAVDGAPAVLLYQLADLSAEPVSVPLSAAPEELRLTGDGGSLMVALGLSGQLAEISLPAGVVRPIGVAGEVASSAEFMNRTLVAARDRRAVVVMNNGLQDKVIQGNLFSVDQIVSTKDHAVVLDRARNALFELDVPAGKLKQGLRAGEGSTNAVTDRFGRVLVADTRGGALLAFSLDPLLMRQRYPVGDAPYGIAYDPLRDLVWVTLTATNEVVGYHVAGEEPRERYRFPTVAQPNAVTVDPTTGRVFVASANAEGIQVISL